MCAFKTLYQDQDGFVVYCKHCIRLHVGYGTTVLSLSVDDFHAFAHKIAFYSEEHSSAGNRDTKSVPVATSCKEITLMYSPDDLQILHVLLSKAKERLLLEKLFIFHEN